ncbi:MAG: glucose-6-phosphate dehydrogenase [Elusimicrobiota bacterium]
MTSKPDQNPQPCALVIFGASGDLTKRKLIPAIYNLAVEGWLPEQMAVIGLAVDPLSTQSLRQDLGKDLQGFLGAKPDPAVWKKLESKIDYIQGDFADDACYQKLSQALEKSGLKNCVFYLAVPPSLAGPIVDRLAHAGLTDQARGFRRVVVEKPFGHDLESAKALNADLLKTLDESQIYRIDHYLGKETVQNLLVLRFANGIFEPIWNRRYVDHVQITAAEDLGVEHRGAYYERAGALRDMVQSHIFQLMTLCAMEPPASFDPDAVRGEQAKIIQAVEAMTPAVVAQRCVRGQYGAGKIGGKKVPGYREEISVKKDSGTETFAALKILIDNWRWAGVPFYLRTGKRLARRATEIAIRFQDAPLALFHESAVSRLSSNELVIRIQPEEGISLGLGAKIPGPSMQVGRVDMNFQYEDYFGKKLVTGYERLLHDVFIGDATLYRRADMVESSWRIIDPILDAWSAQKPSDFPNYPAGSWGPADADALLARDGRVWRRQNGDPGS